jgi:hypothetical protein
MRYARRSSERSDQEIRELVGGSRRILVGPWTSEIGFELLYWIPMLNWLRDELALSPERVVAVSRGGADPWYSRVADSYIDLLDHFSPDDLKRWNMRRVAELGTEKHIRVARADRDIFHQIRDSAGLPDVGWLHPALMYRLFNWYWHWEPDTAFLERHLRPEPLTVPDENVEQLGLPTSYVALKAYFSSAFPDTSQNRSFLGGLLRELSATANVVILTSPLSLGDHDEFRFDVGDRVIDTRPLLEPRHNLGIQSRIIRGAASLVSTYGGFAYLGPYLGTPTRCFYSRETFTRPHLQTTRWATDRLPGASAETMFVMDDVEAFSIKGRKEVHTQAS